MEWNKLFAKNNYLGNTESYKSEKKKKQKIQSCHGQIILINNSQKGKEISNKYTTMCSKLPVMSDTEIKLTMKYYIIPIWLAKVKEKDSIMS